MANGNPIQYTSRTYNTILNDINSDPNLADKPNWFKRLIAGMGDVLSMYENAIANQSFLRTAFTRQAVTDLCALIDYTLSPQSPSQGILLYYLNADTVSFPKTIIRENLKARSQGTLSISSKLFETRTGATINATSETFTTNFASDNNLDVARVYTTGEKVRVSSTISLPSPLQANTDYYVIYISDTEIRLATTLANAYSNTEIFLTDDGTGAHTIELFSFQVNSYQQQTIDTVTIGTGDGITEWLTLDLPDLNIIDDTLAITINGTPWTKVETFVDSTNSDKHYRLFYNTENNSSKIIFGNGVYGAIPGNFAIQADYAIGGGLDSNISNIDRINVYAGSDVEILGVSNPQNFTGGSNSENIENAKIIAPLLLKARNRFVTAEDGEALVLNYDGITRVKVIRNAYGVLSCKVLIVPSGGGLPSSQLKSDIQSYLIDRSVLESIDVRVVDPTYITITPIASVKILPSYLYTDVEPFVILALRLLFSEVTYELQQDFEQNGISSAVDLINDKWSTSFDANDYTQIINLLNAVTATNFGTSFQESDVLGFVDQNVDGVDYITISSPSFPITIDDDEISTDNVLDTNISEIP
jgi:hypothetical protein